MRIVIVEQDAALGLFLRKGLSAEGHEVTWTDDYSEARSLTECESPHLMVIDTSVEEGVALLTGVHGLHRPIAILTLLRSNSVEDRVRSLDLGADDCMTKPFSFQELTARCRALLRRQKRSGEVLLTHGSLSLNRISRSISLGGEPLNLTAKEFRLLEHLVQNEGRCCSRKELLTEVFQLPAANATNVVDVYINYLRKKLSRGGEAPEIVTVRGAGYRLRRIEVPRMAPMGHRSPDLEVRA